MNSLNRNIFFAVGVAAVVALPLGASYAFNAYANYKQAEQRFHAFEQYHDQQQTFMAKVKRYKAFVQSAKLFDQDAKQAGIDPKHWLSYNVNIKGQPFDAGNVSSLLDIARNGSGYYFDGKSLDISNGTGAASDTVNVSLEGTFLVYDRL